MSKYNLILLDAPTNSSGITIDGESFETDGANQVLIPSYLTGEAFTHGFKVAVEKAKPMALKKASE